MRASRSALLRSLTKIRRFIERTADAALNLCLLVLMLTLALVWLVQTRPVSVAFLMPYIWPILETRAPDVQVNYADVTLFWPGPAKPALLGLKGIELGLSKPEAKLDLPDASVAIDLRASWARRNLVLDDVQVDGADLVVTLPRSDSGAPVDQSAPSPSSVRGEVDNVLKQVLPIFRPSASGPQLRHAQVTGTHVRIHQPSGDRSLEMGPIALEWRVDGDATMLDGSAQLPAGEASVHLRQTSETGPGAGLQAEVKLDKVTVGPFAAFAGLAVAEKLDSPLSGTITANADQAGHLMPVQFTVQTAQTVADLDGLFVAPLRIDRLDAQGRFDLDDFRLQVEDAHLDTGQTSLSAKLDFYLDPADRHLALGLKGQDIDHGTLIDFWPVHIVPQVRAWLIENLRGGKADSAALDVTWRQRPPGMPDDVQLDSTFDASGIDVGFLDDFPALDHASGKGHVTASGMTIDVEKGNLAGMQVDGGRLTMVFAPRGQPDRLALDARAHGDLKSALKLVQQLPNLRGVKLPISPAQVSGSGSVALKMALPISDDIAAKDVELDVTSDLTGAAIRDLEPGLSLSGGTLTLNVDKNELRASGTGRVNGVAAQIESVTAPFSSSQPSEANLTLAIDQSVLNAYKVDASSATISGTIPTHVQVLLPAHGGDADISVDADLGPAGIVSRSLYFTKARGAPGRARFKVAKDTVETRLTQLDVITPDLELQGAVTLGVDDSPKAVHLTNLVYGLSRFSGDIEISPQQGYVGTIRARTLDLRSLGGDDEKAGAGTSGSGGGQPANSQSTAAGLPPLDLTVTSGEVLLPGGIAHDLDLQARRSPGAWQRIDLKALLPSGSPITFKLGRQGARAPFSIDTADAGAVLTALDRGAIFGKGGRLHVEGVVVGEAPLRFNGRLELRDFEVERAPLLAKILTLASFTGIVNTLQGNGIFFDRGTVKFDVDGSQLRLTDGLVHGSEIGLTAEGRVDLDAGVMDLNGTVIPAYTINRILAEIPGLGRLLRGKDGVGAFAVTYTATGKIADPGVQVNPLSIIVPGTMRDLFEQMGGEAQR